MFVLQNTHILDPFCVQVYKLLYIIICLTTAFRYVSWNGHSLQLWTDPAIFKLYIKISEEKMLMIKQISILLQSVCIAKARL